MELGQRRQWQSYSVDHRLQFEQCRDRERAGWDCGSERSRGNCDTVAESNSESAADYRSNLSPDLFHGRDGVARANSHGVSATDSNRIADADAHAAGRLFPDIGLRRGGHGGIKSEL